MDALERRLPSIATPVDGTCRDAIIHVDTISPIRATLRTRFGTLMISGTRLAPAEALTLVTLNHDVDPHEEVF